MMKKRLLSFLLLPLFAGVVQAQVKTRQVIKEGKAIPDSTGTFQQVNQARAVVLDNGNVIFHTSKGSGAGVAGRWDTLGLDTLLATGDDSAILSPLPTSFKNGNNDVHTDPVVSAPSFSLLTQRSRRRMVFANPHS